MVREVSAREQNKYNKSKSNPIVITNPFSPPKYTVTTHTHTHSMKNFLSLLHTTIKHSHSLSLVNVESKNEELFQENLKVKSR